MALKTTRGDGGGPMKGRGAPSNLEGRYESWTRERCDDGWGRDDGELPALKTEVTRETAKSIISRNDSPDLGFTQSINPYRGCEHGCVYCLAGETAVLMADGGRKPLAELRAGDEIYGTDQRGRYRRYVKTRVLAQWQTRKPAYRLRLADGTELVASADHRFLTERGWKFVGRGDGPEAGPRLTLNDALMGLGAAPRALARRCDTREYQRGYLCGLIRGASDPGSDRTPRASPAGGDRHEFRVAPAVTGALDRAARSLSGFGIATDPCAVQTEGGTGPYRRAIRARASIAAIEQLAQWPPQHAGDWACGFVAGAFDAEGFYDDETVGIASTDWQLIGAARSALARLAFGTVVETTPARARCPVHYLRVRGGRAEHLRFLRCCDPSLARTRGIAGQTVHSQAGLAVVAVERLDAERDLFDITTGTGDFIANGVISHNCYARPAHAYLGLSPGLDFETRLFAKVNAAELLRRELAAPSYRCAPIVLGANTDPYQPIEREHRITRSIIEVLAECVHPFTLVSKNALIERDIDLIAPMAARRLAQACISVTNLDAELARKLEPRASAPYRRLDAIARLAAAGIPVTVLVAPVIPFITDRHIEQILERAQEAGATGAGYVLLRLPHEVAPLFKAWLATHYPLKAEHVMSLVRQMRGGRDYDATWGERQRGTGNFADLIAKRFALACKRLGLNRERAGLDTSQFRPPRTGPQMNLF